jgi:hypothetical protein
VHRDKYALAGARETVASIRTVELTWNSSSHHIRLWTGHDVHLERCGTWMADSVYFREGELNKYVIDVTYEVIVFYFKTKVRVFYSIFEDPPKSTLKYEKKLVCGLLASPGKYPCI